MAIPGSCIAPCAYLLEQFITFALTITNDGAYQRGAKIYMSVWKAQEQAFSTHSSSPAGWERWAAEKGEACLWPANIFQAIYTPHQILHQQHRKGGKERKEEN